MDASSEKGPASAPARTLLYNAAIYYAKSLHSTTSPAVDTKEESRRTTPGER